MKLYNKLAIVTGGASGFGEAICRLFAEEGAEVIILDNHVENGQKVADSIGDAAHFIQCDLQASAEITRAFDSLASKYGKVDILVNNAGYTHARAPLDEVGEDEFDKVFNINVKAIFWTSKLALPLMAGDSQSVILNMASTAAIRPRPELTWYNASKGAVVAATKSMAIELADRNIRVCAINPVMGETGLLEKFMGMDDTPENRSRFTSTIPLGRLSTPNDIANAALYLASDDASMVTGIALEVDGGRCI
ncbi:glucose 1-dehydrogenase [Idiomarina sp. HP20-50]|uniref:glucose 1-dehydrogenase n=1 Tax=Idiomarina sp. HP20-50 TaxID=3070813 RepID=UPI00294AB813|nr:glucose 1-dehydrogenase [Idiomarina sp. HP20-50]MDV6316244.1 glucose 1-dehydrogenase [Idiomarina sp. HP20-50]